MPGVQAFSFPSNESFARHQFPLGVGGGGARAPDPSTATISCRQVVAVGSGVNVRTNVHPAPTSERERQRENDNNRTMQPFLSFGVIVGYPVVLSYALVFTLVRWRAATFSFFLFTFAPASRRYRSQTLGRKKPPMPLHSAVGCSLSF